MTALIEVVSVAFFAQLAVLPGEKVQFIIAGLSTRYRPSVVVAAAGSAFAIWTALEIALGGALKGALPPIVLNAATAVFFLLFAVLLFRSAPDDGSIHTQTDGGAFRAGQGRIVSSLFERDFSTYLGGFLPIFAMMFAGEFGDKTQLVTISLALQYGSHPGIWLGEMLAIIPVSLANAFFFHRFAHRFDVRKAHFAGAGIFAFFGLDTLLSIATGFSVWETIVSTLATALQALIVAA